MSIFVRALACVFVAICMASMSLSAAGHSVVILDESVPHGSVSISEEPCPDCGTHEAVGCGQACSAAAYEPVSVNSVGLILVDIDLQTLRPNRLRSAALSPPVTPPIT